jgi:DNA-directed RNA polymerase specialized sigma24 family protein
MPTTLTVYDSDERLATALQEANREALSILYDRYAATLFGVLQKITGNMEMAEEALQVCFTEIWQKKDIYNSSLERLFAWMFRMARDAANKVIVEKSEASANQEPEFVVNSNKQRMEQMKNSALITELIIFGNFSQEEAAEKMGVSITELRIMLRKEINKLRGI